MSAVTMLLISGRPMANVMVAFLLILLVRSSTSFVLPVPSHHTPRPLLTLFQSAYENDDEAIPVIQYWSSNDDERNIDLKTLSTAAEGNLRSRAKMIVFDKDGTLGDCAPTLKRWTAHMTHKISKKIRSRDDTNHSNTGSNHKRSSSSSMPIIEPQEAVHRFHDAIGWDPEKDATRPSALLSAGAWEDILAATADVLTACDIDADDAQRWHAEVEPHLHATDASVIPSADLRNVLLECRQCHLSIAVCTMDDRAPTDAALRHWKIADLVDHSICGDEVQHAKPHAQPLRLLCERTGGISPDECIVVGDTTGDTGMARNAGALFCIGVLTGSGTPEQLTATGADVVVPDVGHVPSLLKEIMGLQMNRPSA